MVSVSVSLSFNINFLLTSKPARTEKPRIYNEHVSRSCINFLSVLNINNIR